MSAAAVLIVSLDTKSAEARFLRERLLAEGIAVCLMDFGIRDDPVLLPEIAAAEVASRGGATLSKLREAANRASAIDAMAKGAELIVREMHWRGDLLGVLSIGGSGGTTVGTAAMRALPLGVPKVMVSTVASGDTRAFVDISDIMMLNSVADFSGVNPISETILSNAAGAFAGMIRARQRGGVRDRKKLIAATMFGVTTPAVEKCQALLSEADYTLVPFHATGVGGRTMEALIAEGYFDGVLDITTTEWADEVVGGSLSAGPNRLEAAAKAGVPQVVAPGALDMVNFFGSAGVPEKFADRLIHKHSENSYLMRTTPEENGEIGRRIAEKLSLARGHVTVLFPTQGVSALDRRGGPFHSAEADRALLAALRRQPNPIVRIEVLDCHINDDMFARRAVKILLAALEHQPLDVNHAQDQSR
jgi:uncharacterized protein (UPF0261 family)